ncbi:MAG: glycosyltransferase [Ignavibacteria bacterium]|nr:glycosyltransferase [Ignavibacteria bacterium]
MRISIIIVTYNSSRDIITCLNSILKYKEWIHEVIIVDNNSTDETLLLLNKSLFYGISILKNSKNMGFSIACNIGASFSNGDILYFCNPDSKILNNIFHKAIQIFNNASIGCLSPKIINETGHESPYAYKFPHPPFSRINSCFRKLFHRSNSKILQLNYNNSSREIYCDWVLGVSIFIPRNIFNNVNGFVENFFLYF